MVGDMQCGRLVDLSYSEETQSKHEHDVMSIPLVKLEPNDGTGTGIQAVAISSRRNMENEAQLQKQLQHTNAKLLDMGAVALCGFFLSDYPIITAAYRRDIKLFKKYSCCTTKRDFDNDDKLWWAKVNRLWRLQQSTLPPVLNMVRKNMPESSEPVVFPEEHVLSLSMNLISSFLGYGIQWFSHSNEKLDKLPESCHAFF